MKLLIGSYFEVYRSNFHCHFACSVLYSTISCYYTVFGYVHELSACNARGCREVNDFLCEENRGHWYVK
jgi:hypothetical protein